VYDNVFETVIILLLHLSFLFLARHKQRLMVLLYGCAFSRVMGRLYHVAHNSQVFSGWFRDPQLLCWADPGFALQHCLKLRLALTILIASSHLPLWSWAINVPDSHSLPFRFYCQHFRKSCHTQHEQLYDARTQVNAWKQNFLRFGCIMVSPQAFYNWFYVPISGRSPVAQLFAWP